MNSSTVSNPACNTEPDEQSLASQIMGLKKAAAANRVTANKSVNKTTKKPEKT